MASASSPADPSLDAEWQAWKRKYEKIYSQVSNIKAVQEDLRENDLNSRKFVDMEVATKTNHCQGIA